MLRCDMSTNYEPNMRTIVVRHSARANADIQLLVKPA